MVIAKETIRLRYYELWGELTDCDHEAAIAALSQETGLPCADLEKTMAEEVAACA